LKSVCPGNFVHKPFNDIRIEKFTSSGTKQISEIRKFFTDEELGFSGQDGLKSRFWTTTDAAE
jgi:hypothetical protein